MDKNKYQEYINILSVKSPITEENIKSAFRLFVKKYHPDMNKDRDTSEMFKKGKIALDYMLEHIKEYNTHEDTQTKHTQNKFSYDNTRKTHKTCKKSNKRKIDKEVIFNNIFNVYNIWQEV